MYKVQFWILIFTCFLTSEILSQTTTIISLNNESKPNEIYKKLNEVLNKEIDDCCMSSFFKIVFKYNKWFVFIKDNYSVKVYDKNFDKLITEFGRKGRGPGEGEFIQSFEVTPQYILLFDPYTKNLNFFDHEGNYIDKLNLTDNAVNIFKRSRTPIYIGDIQHIEDDRYLLSGETEKGFMNIQNGLPYKNVFIAKLSVDNIEVLYSRSIIPTNILQAIEDKDVISSTATNPFKFYKALNNTMYLFSAHSNEIIGLNILNDEIVLNKTDYLLDEDVFTLHPKRVQSEIFDKKKSEIWSNIGHNLIQLYHINSSLFFVTSKKNVEKNAMIFTIFEYSIQLEQIISIFELNDRIINIDEEANIHTFRYDKTSDNYIYRILSYANN